MNVSAGKNISAWKIAATYIGTVIGAGFASGQEILQFFGFFGYWGIVGITAAGYLFYYFGKIILDLGREFSAESHLPIIQYAGGKYIGVFIDYVITFFLFGALTTMVAGAGAIFQEQFKLASLAGNIFMVGASLITVLAGISGVITAISFVVPVLLAAVFGISIYIVLQQGVNLFAPVFPGAVSPAVPGWPLSALVYVSYNLVMAVAILGPLGNEAKEKDRLAKGAFWGGIGLSLGALAILIAIFATLPGSAGYAVPMIYAARQISPLFQLLYSIILFAEVYTTAVGSLFGFVIRVVPVKNKRAGRVIAGIASLGALLASQVGFTNLVRILFPLVGYAGLFMLGGLLYKEALKKIGLVPEPVLRPFRKQRK